MTPRVCVLALALVLVSRVALADPDAERRGLALYQAGKYAEAAVELEIAYVDTPTPALGFALAQSLRLAGNCQRALDFYRKVLAQAPPAAQRNLAEAMAPCEHAPRDDSASAPRPASAPAQVHRATPAWYTDTLGDVLAGVGVAALAASAGGFAIARDHFRDADAAVSDSTFRAATTAGEQWNRAAIVGTALGAALVIGGVVRYALVGHRHSDMVVEITTTGAIVGKAFAW
jgi:hypothetical protein